MQDRMPPIADAELTPDQREASAELVSGPRGAVFGPFVPLLRSPELMRRVQKTGEYLRYHSALPPRLSEFVILIVARWWNQGFEWHIHILTHACGNRNRMMDMPLETLIPPTRNN